jgi:2-hydroxy-6-oxonona-2,4-dienedioate hydrolase
VSIWTDLGDTAFAIRYAEIGGWSTRVMEAGRGPALVLLHGTGGHLEAYARNLTVLAEHFRVLVYDFPGQGRSGLTDHDLEIGAYVDHLLAVLESHGVERAHLCGESLGGWVAIKFAAAHPERVDRLVLNTPGGTMATPQVMERIRTLTQRAADEPTEEHIRTRLEWLMADPASVTDELVEVRSAIYSRPGFAGSMRHVLCLQDETIRRRNLVSDDDLKAIEAPALVVWTSDDPSGPAGAGMAMADAMPLGEFRLIGGAGHWPQWEQPTAYNAAMLEFLLREKGSPG